MQMFQLFGQPFSVLEGIGFFFGVAGVWLTIRQNILCFPIGIINVGIYSFIFFNSGFYANAVLQLFYVVVLIYGWIHWKNKTAQNEILVTTTGRKLWLLLLPVIIVSSALFGYLIEKTSNAPLPYWDAVTTSMSLAAQWMVARKKLENWLVWIVADIIYAGMYAHQSFYLTAILYFIFLILAFKGYAEWKRALNRKTLSALH